MLDKRNPLGFLSLIKALRLRKTGVREKKRAGKPLVKRGFCKLWEM
jgi:hypothetical protein